MESRKVLIPWSGDCQTAAERQLKQIDFRFETGKAGAKGDSGSANHSKYTRNCHRKPLIRCVRLSALRDSGLNAPLLLTPPSRPPAPLGQLRPSTCRGP